MSTATTTMPPQLLDTDQVAAILNVSKKWVLDHVSGRRNPRIRGMKMGDKKGTGLWRFHPDDVHAFISELRR